MKIIRNEHTRGFWCCKCVALKPFFQVLWNVGVNQYNAQKAKALYLGNYTQNIQLTCCCFLKQLEAQPRFSSHVSFTNKYTFSREDISNTQNHQVWASCSLQDKRPQPPAYQKGFNVNTSQKKINGIIPVLPSSNSHFVQDLGFQLTLKLLRRKEGLFNSCGFTISLKCIMHPSVIF